MNNFQTFCVFFFATIGFFSTFVFVEMALAHFINDEESENELG